MAVSMVIKPSHGMSSFTSTLEAIASPRLVRPLAEAKLGNNSQGNNVPQLEVMHGREWARRLSLDSRRPMTTARSTGRRPARPTGLRLPDWAVEQKLRVATPETIAPVADPIPIVSPGPEELEAVYNKEQLNPATQPGISNATKPAVPCCERASNAGANSKETRRGSPLAEVSIDCVDVDAPASPALSATGSFCSLKTPTSVSSQPSLQPLTQPAANSGKRNVWRRLSFTEHSKSQRNIWRRMSLSERSSSKSASNSGMNTEENSPTHSAISVMSPAGKERRSRFAFSLDSSVMSQVVEGVATPPGPPAAAESFRRRSASVKEKRVSREIPQLQPVRPPPSRRWIEPTALLNDAVYEGGWTDRPDGEGLLITPSFAYMGHFRAGLQHGYGVYVCLVSKCRYEGMFVDGAASDHGRLLMLTAGPTYVYGRFSKGKFVLKTSCSLQDRNEAVQAAAKGREAAEGAIARASLATRATFAELTQEMVVWAKSGQHNRPVQSTEKLPWVNPGPLTQMITTVSP